MYYLKNTSGYSLNNIGQDLLLIIYPLVIFIISSSSIFDKFNNKIYLQILTVILSLFYILDFVMENIGLIEKVFWLDIKSYNIPYVDLVNLTITEMATLLLIVLYLLNRSEVKTGLVYILPFCFLSLAASQSRSILLGSILFTIFELIDKNSFSFRKNTVYFFSGILLSFSITIDTSIDNFKNFYESKHNLEESFLSYSNEIQSQTIRSNSISCYFDSFAGDKRENKCEIFLETKIKINDLIELTEVVLDEEIKNISKVETLNTLELEKFINSYNELDSFGGYDILSKSIISCSTENIIFVEELPCSVEILEPITKFFRIRENFYSENVCLSNVTWRINLWKKAIESQLLSSKSILLGKGVGFAIPKEVITVNQIEYFCYEKVISSERPLRNLHNTLITFLYRFGIINAIIFGYFIYRFLERHKPTSLYGLFFVVTFLTFLEPLLDGPIIAIPFWYLIFIYSKSIRSANKKN